MPKIAPQPVDTDEANKRETNTTVIEARESCADDKMMKIQQSR